MRRINDKNKLLLYGVVLNWGSSAFAGHRTDICSFVANDCRFQDFLLVDQPNFLLHVVLVVASKADCL